MNKTPIKLLLIEDNPADVIFLQVILDRDPRIKYLITTVERLSDGLKKIQTEQFEIVLLDLGLPDSNGLDSFKQFHEKGSELPVIVLSGLMDEQVALQAVYGGAQDYVVKGTTGWDSLSRTIRYAIERKQSQQALLASEARYRDLFENSPVALWEEDFSRVKEYIDALKSHGVIDLDAYFTAHTEVIAECIELVQVKDVNQAALNMYEATNKSELLGGLRKTLPDQAVFGFKYELLTVANGETSFHTETTVQTFQGNQFNVALSWAVAPGYERTYSKVLISLTDMTERKQAEEKLRQSEEQYRYLFENNPHPMWAYDRNTLAFLAVNDAAVEKYGYSRAEFMNMTIADIRPAEDIERLKQSITQPRPALQKSGEWRHKLKGGWIIDVEITSHSLILNDHEAALVVAQDITERKLAEQKYQQIFEYSPEGIFQSTPDGRFINVNPAMAHIYGYASPQEIIESIDNIAEQIYLEPGDRVEFTKLFNTSGKVENFEMKNKCKDGSVIWTSTSARTIRNTDGNILYYEGFLQDITERKQAEEALKNSEHHFRALIENGLDYISLLDKQGNLLWESPSSSNLLGYKFNEYVGRSIFELMHPDDLEWVSQQFPDLANQPGNRISGIFCLRHHDGSWRWVEATASNFLDDSSVNAIVINYRDITERKLAEDQLHQKNDDLGLINTMNDAVIRGESLTTIVNLLSNGLKHSFACQGINVYMLNANGTSLALQHYRLAPEIVSQVERLIGNTIPLINIPIREGGYFHKCLLAGQGLIISDPQDLQEWAQEFIEAIAQSSMGNTIQTFIPSIYHSLKIKSAISVPLLSEGIAIGILDLSSSDILTADDLKHVENLSRQLTAAIQRQQADEKVRRSEEFLNSVQNALSAHMAILDDQGKIVRINSAWRKFAEQNGYEHPNYGVGVNYLEICDSATGANAEGAKEVAAAIRELLSGKKREAQVEYPCHGPEERRWFILRITKFNDGNQNWVVLAHENITERKQAEESLKQTGEQFRTLFEASPEAILLIDPHDNWPIIDCNEKACQMNGYTRAELIGQPIDLFNPFPGGDEAGRLEYLESIRAAGVLRYDDLHRHKDGTVFPIEVSTTLIQFGNRELVLGLDRDITERKRMEEALRISAEENQAIINAVPDLLFRINRAGVIVGYHARDIHELRVGPEAFVGNSILEILPAQVGSLASSAIAEACDAGKTVAFEYEHTLYSAQRFYENRMVPLSNNEALAIIRDITDRKQTEKALQESEIRYRNLVDQLPSIAYTDILINGIGYTQYISPQIETILGFKPQEWIEGGFDLWKTQIHPDDREWVTEQYLDFMTRGQPFECEYRIQTKTGKTLWLHDQFRVRVDEHGQILSSHGILSDITERKQAEKSLEDSEERYRNLIDQLPVIVYTDTMVNETGLTQYVSPQIETILGFKPKEWVDGGFDLWRNQIHPEDRERVIDQYLSCVRGGDPFECEYRLLTKTGQIIWLHEQSRTFFDAQHQPLSIHGISYNITERKQAEEDRRRRLAEMEALYVNGLAISSLLDPKLISEKVVEVLSEKLHWHHAAIRLYHPETNQLELVALNHPGLSENQLHEQIERLNSLISDPNKGLTGWVIKQQLPLRSSDLPSDPRYTETYSGMQSGLYVPILTGERVLGAISVESENEAAFSEQDERLLMTMANQAAVAIENAQLYLIVQKELEERQQAEERLRESEARQNGIIEAAMDAIISVDETQQIVLFNAAAEKIFGFPAKAALGQPLARFIPERFRAAHKKHIEGFGETGVTTRNMNALGEVSGLRSDGTEFPLEASISQITVAGTKLYTIILRDITQRKIAEAQLRQSEENYRLLFELSPEGIITHNGRQVTFANAAAAKLVGAQNNQDLIGRPILGFIHPDYQHLITDRIQKQTEGILITPVEEKFVRLDGSFVDVEVNAAPIRVQGDLAFLVTVRDITERKHAEEALRQSEEKYRLLAEELEQRVYERTAEVQDLYNNAPCGYHSLDENGALQRINETEINWLGYAREEILNQPFNNFLTMESRSYFNQTFTAFKEQGSVKDLEFDLIRKDGSTLPVIVSATAVFDKDHKYLTSRSTLFDNTERKFALETLRLANSEMKRALRTKDEFLANMSHELRTPLNAILGLSESLLEQTAGPLNDKQQKYLVTVNESGSHLLELINDILDLAKVEAGQIKLDPGKVDINNVCQSSLRMIKQLAQKKNQTVEVNIESNIGLIWADERRLKQMIVNLLSNAVKFTPEGGKLGLNAQIDYKDAKLLINIWDNGIGIREEDLPRLFQPFVQLDSSLSRESSGTGLGLALVAQMARLHGGSISVSSAPGNGSRFTIILPWDPTITTETIEKFKITGRFPSLKSLPGKPRTILMVEDTDSVVMMVRDYLELSGYKVEVARDGVSGVTKAIALQPDLILMDVQMPGMDGFDATRRIRLEPTLKTTPIIALTALAMANDRERCLEAGMNDYASKPINLRQLVKTIQNHLAAATGTAS